MTVQHNCMHNMLCYSHGRCVMKSIQKLIEKYGGQCAFYEGGKVAVIIDPFNDLEIELEGKTSPNGIASAGVTFITRERGAHPLKLVMRFEICDFGWLPYYFRNELEGFEGKVYKTAESGYVSVDPAMRLLLKEAARFWDEQLALLDYAGLCGS